MGYDTPIFVLFLLFLIFGVFASWLLVLLAMMNRGLFFHSICSHGSTQVNVGQFHWEWRFHCRFKCCVAISIEYAIMGAARLDMCGYLNWVCHNGSSTIGYRPLSFVATKSSRAQGSHPSALEGILHHRLSWASCRMVCLPKYQPKPWLQKNSIMFLEAGLTQTKGRIGWKVGLLDLQWSFLSWSLISHTSSCWILMRYERNGEIFMRMVRSTKGGTSIPCSNWML
jgi:hypothetical protein